MTYAFLGVAPRVALVYKTGTAPGTPQAPARLAQYQRVHTREHITHARTRRHPTPPPPTQKVMGLQKYYIHSNLHERSAEILKFQPPPPYFTDSPPIGSQTAKQKNFLQKL